MTTIYPEHSQPLSGPVVLRHALTSQRPLIFAVLGFGIFVNLLVLTGPLFALLIYDRVLGSRSVETLVVLMMLMSFLFLMFGILDYVRKRIASRVGERIVSLLEKPVFNAVLAARTLPGATQTDFTKDLEIVRQFFASPLFVAVLDLPWMPVFLLGIALFHPLLGWLSLFGVLVVLLMGVRIVTLRGTGNLGRTTVFLASQTWAQLAISDREITFGLDLKNTANERWRSLRQAGRTQVLGFQDRRDGMTSMMQTFRLFMQSVAIGLGAYLVLQDQLTAGAIIATTVLLARALGATDQICQGSANLRDLLGAWRRLRELLAADHLTEPHRLPILADAGVHVDQLTVFPPASPRAVLRMVGFDLAPGQVLGVVGPSGSGKTTLARALAGIWPTAGGVIRFGAAPITRIDASDLCRHIGYLPQNMQFPQGTIAQNIARFSAAPNPDTIVDIARRTGAHDMIVALPAGYETKIGGQNSTLAAGLVQRIGLARAFCHDPALLILDEPENNLDPEGTLLLRRLVQAASSAGKSVIIMSQRSDRLAACNRILVLNSGTLKEHHTRDSTMRNPANIERLAVHSARQGGEI